jgi:hypothetical protein
MTIERCDAAASQGASLVARSGLVEVADAPHFVFDVTCVDANGNLRWKDGFRNLVCTGGKNDLLDKYFAGASYTASWFVGLISSVGYSAVAAADTMSSHAGWTEAGPTNAPSYSQGTRPALAFSSASGGSKATSSASAFSITQTGTVKGAFVTTGSAKDGTTGILYSAGLFTGGDRPVLNGDTLNVSAALAV